MENNDNKDKFAQGMQNFMNTSKKVLKSAGKAVQEFSDKSVIKIEKSRIVKNLSKAYEELGKLVFDEFAEKTEISRDNEKIEQLIAVIKKTISEISQKDEEYNAVGKNKSEDDN